MSLSLRILSFFSKLLDISIQRFKYQIAYSVTLSIIYLIFTYVAIPIFIYFLINLALREANKKDSEVKVNEEVVTAEI